MSSEYCVDLSRQALGRPLTPDERALADAMEAIFATGRHDFAILAAELQARGIARPSGSTAAWTPDALESELRTINDSLDAAYAAGGAVPLA